MRLTNPLPVRLIDSAPVVAHLERFNAIVSEGDVYMLVSSLVASRRRRTDRDRARIECVLNQLFHCAGVSQSGRRARWS